MKYLKGVVIGLIFFSCSGNTVKQTDLKFRDYLASLERLPFPLDLENKQGAAKSSNYDTLLFRTFKQQVTNRPLGKLFENDSVVWVVEEDQFDEPYITTFDRRGHKLDSLKPHRGYDNEYGHTRKEYARINENKEVVVVDSTWHTDQDKKGKLVEKSIQITAYKIIYSSDSGGKFKMGARNNLDSLEITGMALRFYDWYIKTAGGDKKEEYEPVVGQDSTGTTTFSYDQGDGQLQERYVFRPFSQEVADHYEECKPECEPMHRKWDLGETKLESAQVYWVDLGNTSSVKLKNTFARVFVDLGTKGIDPEYAIVIFQKHQQHWRIDDIYFGRMPDNP